MNFQVRVVRQLDLLYFNIVETQIWMMWLITFFHSEHILLRFQPPSETRTLFYLTTNLKQSTIK